MQGRFRSQWSLFTLNLSFLRDNSLNLRARERLSDFYCEDGSTFSACSSTINQEEKIYDRQCGRPIVSRERVAGRVPAKPVRASCTVLQRVQRLENLESAVFCCCLRVVAVG